MRYEEHASNKQHRIQQRQPHTTAGHKTRLAIKLKTISCYQQASHHSPCQAIRQAMIFHMAPGLFNPRQLHPSHQRPQHGRPIHTLRRE
jgi:hypothetical protein